VLGLVSITQSGRWNELLIGYRIDMDVNSTFHYVKHQVSCPTPPYVPILPNLPSILHQPSDLTYHHLLTAKKAYRHGKDCFSGVNAKPLVRRTPPT